MKAMKAYKGFPMEGPIAAWYTRITLKDLKRHTLMARQLVSKIPAHGSVLEIAPGPGYFCLELARQGQFHITGLDISRSFVAIASKNAERAGIAVDFQAGNASDMPFGDGTFDFTFCQAAFKNFTEPVKAISEMYRVLKPNGVAVMADMRRDASREDMEREVQGMGLGGFNRAVTLWTFTHMLVKSAYSVSDVESMVAQTPFAKCRIEAEGVGFQAWMEK